MSVFVLFLRRFNFSVSFSLFPIRFHCPYSLFFFFFLFSFFLLSLLPSLLTFYYINSLTLPVDFFISLAVSDSPPPPTLSITAGLNHLSRCASTLSHLSFFSLLHPTTTIWSRLSRYLSCEPIFTRLASPFRFLFFQSSCVLIRVVVDRFAVSNHLRRYG